MVDGTQSLGAGAKLVLTGRGKVRLAGTSLQGPWNAHYAIRLDGMPMAIGGQDGTVTGRATLQGNVLQIRSQVGSGSFFSQTPAVALGGAAGDPSKDFDLPVQTGSFC